jgi:hypothetical protein
MERSIADPVNVRCRRCKDTTRAPGVEPKEPKELPPCPTCGKPCLPCAEKFEAAMRRYWPFMTCGLCVGTGRELSRAEYQNTVDEREAIEARIRERDPDGYRAPPPIEAYPGPHVEAQK